LYHAEFNYNFVNEIHFAEIQVGGNFRQYSLFSDGTIFNEDPDEGTNFQRININEFGAYTQISKTLAEILKLTASVRYDKNENFEGRVTPRISAVATVSQNHNIRVSFQTGFRNPDTQAQYIFFPVGTNTLLGSAKDNAQRYGVHEGGAYTRSSYEAFLSSGGRLADDGTPVGGNSSLLVEDYVEYVKPEQLTSFEVGYKGLITQNFIVDVNWYYTSYSDFIGGDDVAAKFQTVHQGTTSAPGTIYSPYRNSPEDVTSQGIGVGLTYNLPRAYSLTANYNWATFDSQQSDGSTFRAGFNTPKNKFSVGIGNRKVTKNFGFNLNFRWQEEFLWQSDFGDWIVPEFGVFDAMVSYRIPSIKTIAKLGGSNLFGGDYRTNLGGPFVGQQYYISLTFDEFFK
jgi:outer membrane receptor protein involved in Fe transport